VDTFQSLVLRFDQMQGYNADMSEALFNQEERASPARYVTAAANIAHMLILHRQVNGAGQRWQGVKEMDPAEEEYFNTSDDEEDLLKQTSNEQAEMSITAAPAVNGTSPVQKPLVDYAEDEDDAMDTTEDLTKEKAKEEDSVASEGDATSASSDTLSAPTTATLPSTPTPDAAPPPERLSEKRRREEDEEDELGKLSSKRRTSVGSNASVTSNATNGSGMLLRKKSFTSNRESSPKTKIAISLTPTIKSGGDGEGGGDQGS
jgi:protein phosphatase 4 regulatory subunit 3